jgi:hypothetical protein
MLKYLGCVPVSDDCLIVLVHVYTEIIIFVAIFINYIPIWQYNTKITFNLSLLSHRVCAILFFISVVGVAVSVSTGHSIKLWSTATFRYSSLKSSPLKQMTTRLF